MPTETSLAIVKSFEIILQPPPRADPPHRFASPRHRQACASLVETPLGEASRQGERLR